LVGISEVTLKIVIASSALVGVPVLEQLIKDNQLIAAISSPDQPSGRGRILTQNKFAQRCEELGVITYKPESDLELRELLIRISPDVVVTAAYGKLIKQSELVLPKHGWLNIHFSLLPRWRGASPVQHAILHGDKETGVTVFKLDKGMDTGPIYASCEYELKGDETGGELLEILSHQALAPLQSALTAIENGKIPVPQSEHGAIYAPKLAKAQGRIDWSQDAYLIERAIRAFNPWPGSWCSFNNTRLVIVTARVFNGDFSVATTPGELIINKSVYVKCGSDFLELLTVKPEGKKVMSASEWQRGLVSKSDLRLI
jgi:methionyl-tRNA formyltransferase